MAMKVIMHILLVIFILSGVNGSSEMPQVEVSETKMPFFDEEGNEHKVYELFTFISPSFNRVYSVFLPLPPSPWARDGISFTAYNLSNEEVVLDVTEEEGELLWKSTFRYYEEKKAKEWKQYRTGKNNDSLKHVNQIKFP